MTIPHLAFRQLPPVFRYTRPWLFLAAGLVALACQSGAARPPAQAPPSLSPGVPADRRLEAGGSHDERLRLKAGEYLLVTVRQKEVDVAVSLLDPAGREIASADDPEGRVRPERLAVIAQISGEHRLRIVPHSAEAPAGTYEVEIRELRLAGPGDEERVAAEKAFAEGRRLQNAGDGESKRQAVVRLEEALGLWHKAGDVRGQVRALTEIAIAHYDLDELQKSAEQCENALRLAREIGDEEGMAAALHNLGNAYIDLQKMAAPNQFQEALGLWRKLGDRGGEGKSLYSLGVFFLKRNDPDQAFGPLSQAAPLLREVGDLGTEANALTSLSAIYLNRGEIGQALELIDRALELNEKVDQPDSKGLALYHLARAERWRGEMEKALRHFQASLEINQRLGSPYEVFALGAIGAVYHDLGDLDQARTYFERARTHSRTVERKADEARFLNNIGWILYRQGRLEEALDSSSQALAMGRALKNPPLVAAASHNIGVVEIALGRPQTGLAALTEALSIRRGEEGGTLFDQVQTLREIGTAYHRLGDVQRAADSFSQALDLARQIGSPGLQAEALFRQALLDRDQGKIEDALRRIRESLDLIESVRSLVASETLRTSFFASKRSYYELYLDLLMRLHETDPGGGHEAAALAASELARARGLLDLLAGKVDLIQGIDPLLKQREAELVGQLSWILDQLSRQKPDSGSAEAEALRRQLAETESDLERLKAETRLLSPQYAEVRYPTALSLEGAQGLLNGRTAFLEYFVGQESSFLFVVTREGLTSYRLPPAEELANRVRSLREVLRQPNSLQFPRFRKEARELYEELLAPAASLLDGKTDLLISPDGPLHLLPFEVLLTGETGRSFADIPYLLRTHAVSYTPSASVLGGLARLGLADGKASKLFIGFADPALAAPPPPPRTRSASPDLPQLPGTRDEVRAIANLYPAEQVALYMGDLATEENVKSNQLLERTPRVHFATHGLFYEDRPERSALVLTPPGPGSREDGYLRVDEIFNLKLGADLLVLSACETGRGKDVRGEGLVGLTRAFLYAGARSLVVSLWPVQDTTTPELMVGFYSHLAPGRSKAEALRQAKLQMIEGGRAHPYYWAPFVLAGDPLELPAPA